MFTVVGLVGLALLIALVTNAVRRRQAKKFDRDVAEAAREAAAAGHATRPDFDDDDFGYTANRSVYTDTSHGTYSQQPLQNLEAYNMSELPPFDPYATGAAGAGAAGIGAAGLNRAKSQTTPYGAFAGPDGQGSMPVANTNDPFYDPNTGMPVPSRSGYPYGQPQQQTYADPQAGLLEAAGLAGGAGLATGLARGPSQGLSRNRSLGAQTLGGMSSSDHAHGQQQQQQEAYQQQQQQAYGTSAQDYQARYGVAQTAFPQAQPYPQPAQAFPQPEGRPVSMAVSMSDDPYAGYADEPGPNTVPMPRQQSPPHEQERFAISGSPEQPSDGEDEDEPFPRYADDARQSQASLRDDEDYGYGGGRRVLKVC